MLIQPAAQINRFATLTSETAASARVTSKLLQQKRWDMRLEISHEGLVVAVTAAEDNAAAEEAPQLAAKKAAAADAEAKKAKTTLAAPGGDIRPQRPPAHWPECLCLDDKYSANPKHILDKRLG